MPPRQPQATASGFEKIPYNLQALAAADTAAVQPIAGDTEQDIRDMKRLGKKQEFKRNFGFISTFGLISIYMATWEFMLVSLSAGLINGGYGGLFWTFIITVACYSTIVASLAEMESMAPTSGGQYHCRRRSQNLHRVMWWSYILNLILDIIVLIAMLFYIGPLDSALDASTPYVQLFNNTGSSAVSLALNIFLFILIFTGNITALATTSREMFAFARDKGFPASKWISKMDTKRHDPFNAVYITSVLTGVLCLINLGSSLAFNIILSLTLLALLSTYMLSIGCVLLKRLTNQPLPPARWSLGRWGLQINAFAFFYSAFAIVFSCFPVSVSVTLDTANWALAVWVGVTLASWVVYWGDGKRRFTAPVVFVEGWRKDGVGGGEAQMQETGGVQMQMQGME